MVPLTAGTTFWAVLFRGAYFNQKLDLETSTETRYRLVPGGSMREYLII
jgi:hypothetical protein